VWCTVIRGRTACGWWSGDAIVASSNIVGSKVGEAEYLEPAESNVTEFRTASQ
jgi:hypothetical protein